METTRVVGATQCVEIHRSAAVLSVRPAPPRPAPAPLLATRPANRRKTPRRRRP